MITFLDTPGHEASPQCVPWCESDRSGRSGVAADDGVMPQTIEAIHHAKAAKVPLVVAVNKVDKPEANPEKIRQQLAGEQVVPEEWGGDTMFQTSRQNPAKGSMSCVERISASAEVLELRAPKNVPRTACDRVHARQGRGPVATILSSRERSSR